MERQGHRPRVRNRLLPESVLEGNKYERKIKEIIQSIRLTQEFPGVEGKQRIMAAYLNQNYYGNQAYGIKAAAQAYFGVSDLNKLTIAQAAILAAIPQSPTTYDLVKNAEEDDNGKLVVPQDSRIVLRRNQVLQSMLTSRVPRRVLHVRFGSLPESGERCGDAVRLCLVRRVEVMQSLKYLSREVREPSREARLHRLPPGMRS